MMFLPSWLNGRNETQGESGQHPTAITVLRVVGFARPDALVEIDAIAALRGQ